MTTDAARAWFNQARFGMFVHWGLYALLGRHEWTMYLESIPPDQYRPLADRFDPQHYRPAEWIALAQDAGARYVILTSRHHEGFSLWDSKVSEFTAPKTAAKRDLLAEFVEACERQGMKYGFYYSLLDWRFPGYWKGPERDPAGWAALRDYAHAQVEELCTDYGDLAILWYDGGWPYTAADWDSAALNARVRRLRPDIIINDRSLLPEDYDTPEQHVTASEPGRMWESCMTMNSTWGFSTIDHEWKTTRQLVHHLVTAASGGGNYLLNVGPDPDGRIPFQAVERLRGIGRWMDVNAESIYASEHISPRSMRLGSVGRVHTMRGNTLYVHCWRWPGTEIVLGALASRVKSARILGSDHPVQIEQQGHRVWLRGLPAYAPDPIDTVIALEFDEAPQEFDRFA